MVMMVDGESYGKGEKEIIFGYGCRCGLSENMRGLSVKMGSCSSRGTFHELRLQYLLLLLLLLHLCLCLCERIVVVLFVSFIVINTTIVHQSCAIVVIHEHLDQ